MLVNGQLEKAQLEQIAATTTTPAATGRVYVDVTTPLNAIPMFYNGSAWRTIKLGQTTSVISQTSGKAVTVDWSTGLTQLVVLTDNTVISFSNPTAGEVHTLIVQQGNTETNQPHYLYTFNMTDQATQGLDYQPRFGYLRQGQAKTYQWFYSSAIEAAQASPTTNAIVSITAPLGNPRGMTISPDGRMLAMGSDSTPYASFYNLAPTAYPRNIFGQRNLVTPATAVGTVRGVAYSPNGNESYWVSQTTPYIGGYFLDRNTMTGTAFANPGTLPTGAGQCIAVHPSGMFVGVGHATSPFMSHYPVLLTGISGAAYGTKITDPATLPAAAVSCMAWSPQGDYLAVGSPSSPFIQVYPFTITGTTGAFGAVCANPSSLPSTGPAATSSKAIGWRPQGDYIAMADGSTLYVVPFNRTSGAFGTRITAAASGTIVGLRWSPCGTYIYLATNSGASNAVQIVDFSAFTLSSITSVSSPASALDVEVSPDGSTIFWCGSAPTLQAIRAPRRQKNYLLLSVM
jgi:WD40 repeat protein